MKASKAHPSTMNGYNYGVRHISVKTPESLLQCLRPHVQHTDRVLELIQLGAIYLNHKRILDLDLNVKLNSGDYLRVHTEPRRYSVALLKQIKLIYENENFIILHKPSGVPVHATVDNKQENCLVTAQTITKSELFITHRLDVATEGLLLVAKNRNFLSLFNKMLTVGAVTKKYKALIEQKLGHPRMLVHYMEPSPKAPKKLSEIRTPGWLECRLEIKNSSAVQSKYHLVEIQLWTGRTHQIRSQLSFIGAPVVGDQLYGSKIKISEYEKICLQACELEFIDPISSTPRHFILSAPTWSSLLEFGSNQS